MESSGIRVTPNQGCMEKGRAPTLVWGLSRARLYTMEPRGVESTPRLYEEEVRTAAVWGYKKDQPSPIPMFGDGLSQHHLNLIQKTMFLHHRPSSPMGFRISINTP